LDLAGLAVPPGMLGRALFRAVGRSAAAYSVIVPEPLRRHRFDAGPMEAVTTASEKIVVGGKGTLEYYDLEKDPGEKLNIAPARPDRVAALREVLAACRAAAPAAPAGRRDLDEATIKKLRALGYAK